VALVYLNGQLYEPGEARLSVFDHGLVVGDGVFETVLLHRGAPFALTRHLDRLTRSADGLGIGPIDRDEVTHAVAAVVKSAEFTLGRIRITVTAGEGPLGSGRLPSPLTLVVACSPEEEDHGLGTLSLVPWTRNEGGALAGLKTTSYAENARALARAATVGADEALFANTAGMLCEGTGSNIFVIQRGELLTPPLTSGCLAGVTRALVLERFGGTEVDLQVGAIFESEVTEAFLTSTIRGVQPIGRIDSRRFEAPGAVSEKAAALYRSLLEEIDP
jgi:branched-chain amino acid aminotransferase